MKTYVNKNAERDNQPRTGFSSARNGAFAHGSALADNRQESGRLHSLETSINKGAQVMQLAALEASVNRGNVAGEVIQLANRLTMHATGDLRRVGGGTGSGINTGAEVGALIASRNLQDLRDSRHALAGSIAAREADPAPDAGHVTRLNDERTWLGLIEAEIGKLETRQQEDAKRILKAPPPPPPPGPEWRPAPGKAWGSARS